ncbi:MAG: cobalamin-binding protein [Gammaproteobacteria bacterium]|nr:cobalamin-binding protein [Pseudomonadales bacterium]MCP5348649.1 cobalamin-binding protein [Pseudomonadales bacterium]
MRLRITTPRLVPALLLILLGRLVSLTPHAYGSIEVLDDEGNRVRLAQPAERIISLAPSLTEMLFAAGAGDRIVGVVEFSDFPREAAELPVVGRHDLLDLEAIVALRPDLVISWKTGNPAAAIIRLRQLGLTVYVAEPRELASIPRHLEKLATLAGTGPAAQAVIDEFDTALARLQAGYADKPAVRVFYQVWDRPLITTGGDELINDMISLCGGENIFSDLHLMAPKVTTEAVLVRNPEVIIASGMDVARPEWLDTWLTWTQLDAVAGGHLYFIPPDLVQRHTPRALQGVTRMCEQIDRARNN